MIYTIDSSDLIAFIWDEPRADIVEPLLMSSDYCYIHILNLCEVYYDLIRRTSLIDAENLLDKIVDLVIVQDDMDIWKEAGKYKANLRRISLADCFRLTLAKKVNGTVVTADHHEFDKINTLKIVPILFIR